jgi:hypothetical protein
MSIKLAEIALTKLVRTRYGSDLTSLFACQISELIDNWLNWVRTPKIHVHTSFRPLVCEAWNCSCLIFLPIESLKKDKRNFARVFSSYLTSLLNTIKGTPTT